VARPGTGRVRLPEFGIVGRRGHDPRRKKVAIMQQSPPPLAVWLITFILLVIIAACAIGLKAMGVDVFAFLV
jgi:hypothetical protein